MLIAVDVDLTVVDTLTPWMKWFDRKAGKSIRNESGSYDLVPEMREIMKEQGVDFDPMEWWRQPDLYDYMIPITAAVDKLKLASMCGYEVVFVSSCIPEHTKSKQDFLKQWFPFAKGFIATHDKHFVDYDVLIDDKIEHIRLGEMRRPKAIHLLYTGIRTDGAKGEAAQYRWLPNWNSLPRTILGCVNSDSVAIA